jgi:hypothetical protein
MSMRRIAAQLGVALSSVSLWVRDVELPSDEPPPPPPAPDEPVKHCPRCSADLPVSAFNRSGEGRQHWCRDCFRTYFRDRGDLHRRQSREARARRQEPGRALVREHLRSHPCIDCGEDEMLVLEFDHHLGGKVASVGQLLTRAASLERIREEIARCEVVCVNCHRRRTARRAGTFRATRVPPQGWNAYQRRNNAFLLEVLDGSSCIDCGEDDPIVLDFDHIGDKRANVSRLALGCSLAVLQAEIARCEVRCSNCHRLRTLATRGSWRADDDWVAGLHDAVP